MRIAKTKLRLLYLSIELVFGICISQIGPWKYNYKFWHFMWLRNAQIAPWKYNYNNKFWHFMWLSYQLKMDFCVFCCFCAYIKKLMFWPGTHFTPNKMLQISLSSDSQSITGHKIVTCKKMFKFYRQFFLRAHW